MKLILIVISATTSFIVACGAKSDNRQCLYQTDNGALCKNKTDSQNGFTLSQCNDQFTYINPVNVKYSCDWPRDK